MSDPASLLQQNVKVHSVQAKPELNGKVGLAQSYIPDRNRYLISLPYHISPVPVALKADNLTPATFPERMRGKVDEAWGMANAIYHDENLREIVKRGYTSLDQRLPPGVNPKHAGAGFLFFWLFMVYTIGFMKSFTILTLISLGIVVVLPDIMAGKNYKVIVRTFPIRWKEAIAQNTGYQLSQRNSNISLAVFVAVMGMLLLTSTPAGSSGRNTNSMSGGSGGGVSTSPYTLEEIYRFGYEDGQNEEIFGHSLPKDHAKATRFSNLDDPTDLSYDDYSDFVPPQPQKKNNFGLGSMLALFSLGRTIKELGFVNGRFEYPYFIANLRNMPPFKMAFMAFMLYRVLRIFM